MLAGLVGKYGKGWTQTEGQMLVQMVPGAPIFPLIGYLSGTIHPCQWRLSPTYFYASLLWASRREAEGGDTHPATLPQPPTV